MSVTGGPTRAHRKTTTDVWRWIMWLLERDVPPMSAQAVEQEQMLTLAQIDEMLRHHANCIHTDPDPLSRWARFMVTDQWLDCRLRLEELRRNNEPQSP